MKISPARAAAFDILLKIERERAFSAILLPEYESKLEEKDRGLCHTLVMGSLRRQLLLDRVISHFAGSKKLDAEVRVALRLALFQIYFLDRVPDHSAVNESVGLVQRAKKTSAKGFVNAILRKATAGRPELVFGSELERASIETSHPRWLIERWAEQFGPERAAAIAAANNVQPKLAYRFTARAAGSVPLPNSEPSQIVENGSTAERSSDELRRMADEGQIYFQDEASQLVGQTVSIPAGGSFLDVCAAPGSKTSHIAARYSDAGVTTVAGDRYAARIRSMREICARQGLTDIKFVQYDAETGLPFPEAAFDSVLVDAPCSGTGTIRNNPEIRYFLEPGDLPQLHRKQLAILTNASKLVRPGGRLFYSTCSIERIENEEVIAEFLGDAPGFEAVRPNIGGRFHSGEAFGRTFPDRDDTDGFFLAELRRR